MLTTKEICVLTPTFNRPKDIEMTIKGVIDNGNIPGKFIILDQSKNQDTKKIVNKYSKKYKFIEYTHHTPPGKNIALNKVMDRVKNKGFRAYCIMDDDVVLGKDFFNNQVKEFNTSPEIMAIGAVELRKDFKKENYLSWKFKLKSSLFKFFLLSAKEDHKFRILGPYGNTSTHNVERDIRRKDCQWLPGFVSTYRAEALEGYRLPEQLGREIIQDIDMSYYTYLKFGKDSLAIPKNVRAVHNYSETGRFQKADKRKTFVNHEDHFTFYYRYFNNLEGTAKMIWELFWVITLMTVNFIARPKKDNYLKLLYNVQAIKYCMKYRQRIKRGESRMFLSPDLTMKDSY